MPAFVDSSMPALGRWWSAQTDRARGGLGLAAIALGLAIAVFGIAQPLARRADATRDALARDAVALAQARERTAEIASLSRAAAPAAGDARSDVDRALGRSGLRPAVTQIDWQGDRARLTFAGVGFEPLVRFLESLQREARIRVVEANLVARVEPGIVRAELTLAR